MITIITERNAVTLDLIFVLEVLIYRVRDGQCFLVAD